MQFRVPAIYDKVMDRIALVLFPSRRYAQVMLVAYVLLIAAGLVWYTSNWLWAPATLLCVALAWMVDRWLL